MIIANLKGGLGNQMFQYAFGRRLALKNNDELKLEVAGLERANEIGDIYRPFSLGRFALSAPVASAEEVVALKYPYGLWSKGWRWFSFHVLLKMHKEWDPKELEQTGDLFLDGYWQSPKYFEDIREELLREFVLKDGFSEIGQEYLEQIEASESVSLHVRRGDYVANARVAKEFGICSAEYYTKAIEHTREHTNEHTTSPTFFVFSDDIAWVKENLPVGPRAVFVEGKSLTDTEELVLMSRCRHNIIANSSFSWWGAWLNRNPGKVVIAPTPWFDNGNYDPTLLPEEWVLSEK